MNVGHIVDYKENEEYENIDIIYLRSSYSGWKLEIFNDNQDTHPYMNRNLDDAKNERK